MYVQFNRLVGGKVMISSDPEQSYFGACLLSV